MYSREYYSNKPVHTDIIKYQLEMNVAVNHRFRFNVRELFTGNFKVV